MRLERIGEFGLIKRIGRSFACDASVKKGIGDDCAVISLDARRYLLLTCDMLVEGVDFKRGEDLYLVGRKALACSLSDIAACGGLPRYALVSLGIPRGMTVEGADALLKGIRCLARRYKVNVVGGDISRAPSLMLDVSVLGVVERERLLLRSGASEGDIICVSGALGGSISGRHLTFEPRVREARFLTANFKIHAMIDISDGLLQDLSHLLEASGKGAFLYEELIPLREEARSLDDALYMGEDFELLFTLSRAQAKRLCEKSRGAFKPIGEITARRKGLKLIDKSGKARAPRRGGYRHF